MAYWLLKSEPEVFSLDDLERKGVEGWDGVRNYQARNYLRSMEVGDRALFYHSRQIPPGVVGVCEVVRAAYPDLGAQDPESRYYDPRATPEDPRWYQVDVRFVRRFRRLLPLEELKATPGLEEMWVTRKGSRLSVQPVQPEEWAIVLRLAES
ncbi:MAG: EVE domain-containing protein [Candidatus Eremiobacterota bacterium]